MLGTSPKVRSPTASSNSPVSGSPVRENATAPANVSASLRARLSVAETLFGLSLAGDELALIVPDEGNAT